MSYISFWDIQKWPKNGPPRGIGVPWAKFPYRRVFTDPRGDPGGIQGGSTRDPPGIPGGTSGKVRSLCWEGLGEVTVWS